MKKNKGFTLVELLITVAIIGVVASIAVPSFGKMIERNRLKAAVEKFQGDMQHARILAIKQSQEIKINRVRSSATAGDWCYGITAKTADCTCTTVGDCEIKTVLGSNFDTVSMVSETTNNSTFNFRRGTIGSDGVTFYTINYAARVTFSGAGRVRICDPTTFPTGTVSLPGNC